MNLSRRGSFNQKGVKLRSSRRMISKKSFASEQEVTNGDKGLSTSIDDKFLSEKGSNSLQNRKFGRLSRQETLQPSSAQPKSFLPSNQSSTNKRNDMMQARRKIHDTGVQYSETTTNYGFENEHEARDKRCFIEDFCTCEIEERISQQYLYSSDPESRQAMLKKMMGQD